VARANRAGYFPTAVDAPRAWAQATVAQQVQKLTMRFSAVSRQGSAPASASMAQTIPIRVRALGPKPTKAVSAPACVIGDLARTIRTAIDPEFTLDGYADRLPDDSPTFAPLHARLEQARDSIDRLTDDIAYELWRSPSSECRGSDGAVSRKRLRCAAPGAPGSRDSTRRSARSSEGGG